MQPLNYLHEPDDPAPSCLPLHVHRCPPDHDMLDPSGLPDGSQPDSPASDIGLLVLQAYPLQHAIFDLSRLPAGSIPTFGSALPVNMVSSFLLVWGTAVRTNVHQS